MWLRALSVIAIGVASSSGHRPALPPGYGRGPIAPSEPRIHPETGALIIGGCPGRPWFGEMSGPQPVGDAFEEPFSTCLHRHTDGVPGDRLADAIQRALAQCVVFAPDGNLEVTGLYRGEHCLTTRTSDVHTFVTLDGVRALHWEGWAGRECD